MEIRNLKEFEVPGNALSSRRTHAFHHLTYRSRTGGRTRQGCEQRAPRQGGTGGYGGRRRL